MKEQELVCPTLANCQPVEARKLTVTEQLQAEKCRLQLRLDAVNTALAQLEAHSEVQQVIDAISKLHLNY